MSRSGYSDCLDEWDLIRWRGAVTSAIRGKRGQALLVKLRDSLDAMPEKFLITEELIDENGGCCALGCIAKKDGTDVSNVDPEDPDQVAEVFGIAPALAQEIVYENDDGGWNETPEERWARMRRWADKHIANPVGTHSQED